MLCSGATADRACDCCKGRCREVDCINDDASGGAMDGPSGNANLRQEPACDTAGTMVGVEVDVEVARIAEQLRQRGVRRREVRIRDEDAVLPNVDVPLRQIEVDADGAGEPPDDRSRTRPGVQVVNVSEADALISLVVEDHDGRDSAVLEDLDLRVTL